jgi:hypothetical protein
MHPSSVSSARTRATRFLSCPDLALGVGLDNQAQAFLQVAPGLGQRSSLRIHAWDFLYVSHIPSPALSDYGCEFTVHTLPLASF